jgi:hypothetical protein
MRWLRLDFIKAVGEISGLQQKSAATSIHRPAFTAECAVRVRAAV